MRTDWRDLIPVLALCIDEFWVSCLSYNKNVVGEWDFYTLVTDRLRLGEDCSRALQHNVNVNLNLSQLNTSKVIIWWNWIHEMKKNFRFTSSKCHVSFNLYLECKIDKTYSSDKWGEFIGWDGSPGTDLSTVVSGLMHHSTCCSAMHSVATIGKDTCQIKLKLLKMNDISFRSVVTNGLISPSMDLV